jgi:endonuclease/exonuclease/phosphatase family metal-dependent hydrolase
VLAAGNSVGPWETFTVETVDVPLTVLSANIWLGALGDPGLDRLACYFRNADIVFIQEIDTLVERTDRPRSGVQISELSRKSGLRYYQFAVELSDYHGGDIGVAVLSRFPLSNIVLRKVPEAQLGGGIPVIIRATINWYGARVVLFTSHFPHGSNLAQRDKTSIVAAEMVDQVADPIILGGDLNARVSTPEIVRLTWRLSEAFEAAPIGKSHCDDPEGRIDLILFRGPRGYPSRVPNYPYRAQKTDPDFPVQSYDSPCQPLDAEALSRYQRVGCPSLEGAKLSDHTFPLVRFVGRPSHLARYVGQEVPASMLAGQRYEVSLTMKNVGTNTWTAREGYRLGLQNPRDNTTWGIQRVDVPTNVPPGNETTFRFVITAPSIPKSYPFQWAMVQEGETWFGEFSPNTSLSVAPSRILNVWIEPYPKLGTSAYYVVRARDADSNAEVPGRVRLQNPGSTPRDFRTDTPFYFTFNRRLVDKGPPAEWAYPSGMVYPDDPIYGAVEIPFEWPV